MGRPLNKKYFGNRNIGTGGDQTTGNLSNSQNYSDDRIGGEGVASYGTIVAGSGWTTAPTVTFSAPTLPSGVSVAGTAHYKALSFATTANGTGYAVGNILEVNTGTAATKARAPVASVTVMAITLNDGGTANDVGDEFEFSHASLSTPIRVRVTAAAAGVATAVELVNGGVWTASGTPPANTTVAGFTRTQVVAGQDMNGQGLQVNLTQWGVYAFGAVSVAGDYTVFPSTGASGTLDSISPATGTGAKATITMGLLSIAVTEKGSGYVNAADAAVSFSGATSAAATAVLTTDSGAIGSATYQENAIVVFAKTTSGGTNKVGDIIKQVSGRRYKVKTADGIAVCELVTTGVASAAGEMTITATDANSNTYYVKKLTAHRATLVRLVDTGGNNDWVYATGESAPWSFDAASGVYVQIANA